MVDFINNNATEISLCCVGISLIILVLTIIVTWKTDSLLREAERIRTEKILREKGDSSNE